VSALFLSASAREADAPSDRGVIADVFRVILAPLPGSRIGIEAAPPFSLFGAQTLVRRLLAYMSRPRARDDQPEPDELLLYALDTSRGRHLAAAVYESFRTQEGGAQRMAEELLLPILRRLLEPDTLARLSSGGAKAALRNLLALLLLGGDGGGLDAITQILHLDPNPPSDSDCVLVGQLVLRMLQRGLFADSQRLTLLAGDFSRQLSRRAGRPMSTAGR